MESNNLGGVKHSLQFFVQLGDLNSNNITHNPDVAAGLLNSSVTFSHQGFPVPEESKGAEGDAAINLANGSSTGFVLLQDHIDTCSTKISKDLYRRFLSGKPANLSATPARRHVGISVRSAEKAEKYCEEKNPSKDVENCNAYYTVPCSSTSKTFSCLSDTGGDGSPVASVASKCVSESRFCILAKACHERTDNESPDNRSLNFPSFCSADFETRGGSFLALTTEKPSTVSLLENSEEGSTSSDNLFVLENQATQNAIVMDWSRMNATDVNNQITLPVKHNEHLQNGQENISPVVREVSVKDCFCFTESHYPALEPILFSDEQCNEERLQLDLFNTADTKLNKCTGTANSGAILNTTVVFENKSRHHQMLSDDENEEKSKSATLKEDNKKNIEIKNLSSLQVQNQELPESKHKSNQGEEFTSDLIQHSGALEKAFLLHGEETFLICSPLETNKRPVTCTSTPLPESRNMTFMLPELEDTSDYNVEFAAMNSIPESCNTTNFVSVSQMPKSSKMEFIPKSANRKPSVLANKQGKLEIMNFPKPNFKDIKPKVVSRPVAQATGNTSLGKTSPKSQSVKPNSPSPVSSPRLSSHSVKRNIREMAAKQEPPAVLQKQTGNKNRCPGQINSTKVSCKITSTRTERAVSGSKQTFPDPDKASTSGSSISLTCPQRITNAVQYRRRKESIPMNSVLSKTEHHMADMKTRTEKLKQRHASDDTVHERSSELHATPSSAAVTSEPKASSISALKDARKAPACSAKIKATTRTVGFEVKAPAVHPNRLGGISKDGRFVGMLSPSMSKQKVVSGSTPTTPVTRFSSAKGSMTPVVISGKLLPQSKTLGKISERTRAFSLSSACSTESLQSNISTSTATSSKTEGSLRVAGHQQSTSRTVSVKGAVPSTPKTRTQPPAKSFLPGTKNAQSASNLVPKKVTSAPVTKYVSSLNGRQLSVEKAKQKPSPRSPRAQTQILTDTRPTDAKSGLTSFKAKCEKQTKFIQELKQLLAAGNQKLEAITVVVQYFLTQREEALKQRQALSQELATLHGDLVESTLRCKKHEQEKNELQAAYEGMLHNLQEQHQEQLTELEDKYQQYYIQEYEKLQHACKEETDKFRSKLQEKVDILNCTHEKSKQELETSHMEQLKDITEKYEADLAELRASYETEKKTLNKSYTEEHTTLEKKIQQLNDMNTSLKEKLIAEEQRKSFTEKSNQKNPQLVYLEQELESLKAVLEIKIEKLHEQDKKMMFMEKMMENNTVLEEKIKRLQQENEDLKARMNKHVALSRQLSTEQAVLQESLNKESKVNKRLSMENEELLWKLHNGDICSPRKLSPTSPSTTMQSPRNSSSLSSPTVSPR